MAGMVAKQRHFLFLQGPHGPFFGKLAKALVVTGAKVSRIGFNRGDQYFWPRGFAYHPFNASAADWESALRSFVDDESVTDIVLYGDSRPSHITARQVAQRAGLRVHCFEEGYLRPYWATYERGGVNGNSALMNLSIEDMRSALAKRGAHAPPAPPQWGALWHHTWYGFRYHLNFLRPSAGHGPRQTHREFSVLSELRLHARRIVWMPLALLRRRLQTRAVLRAGQPFHLALLQLGHDASLRAHSKYSDMRSFVDDVMAGFAQGAPSHHQLVFKAHPLEDGREGLRRYVAKQAAAMGLTGRVHYIMGGQLGHVLDRARSAVTVNSTAAQQALWRGLPVLALGQAVFAKPNLVSNQSLPAFFARPEMPDRGAYADFRQFLLETSQLSGGYYTAAGRAELVRQLVDRMLSPHDPYTNMVPASIPRVVSESPIRH